MNRLLEDDLHEMRRLANPENHEIYHIFVSAVVMIGALMPKRRNNNCDNFHIPAC